MNKILLYQEVLGVSTIDEIFSAFIASLSDPQRTFNYFVDWKKVRKNVERYKVEIGILGSLVNSEDIEKEMKEILLKYPEILPVFPLIIAVRNLNIQISEFEIIKKFSFHKRKLSNNEIDEILYFCKRTGLIEVFNEIKNLKDYLLGVEVGLDTNARKNRSGSMVELLLTGFLKNISNKHGLQLFIQKQFKILEKSGYNCPANLKERKFDFALVGKGCYVNIETNVYGRTGSKPQEIVDAYINRQKDLNSTGWILMWITDGCGWKGQENQLRKAFNEINYIFNLHFVRIGLLEKILQSLIKWVKMVYGVTMLDIKTLENWFWEVACKIREKIDAPKYNPTSNHQRQKVLQLKHFAFF